MKSKLILFGKIAYLVALGAFLCFVAYISNEFKL